MSANTSEREPLAYSIEDFCKLTGLGRSNVYVRVRNVRVR